MGKLEETYISGEPVPKGRPRFTRSGRTYTPKKTLDHERAIREAWESGNHEPFGDSVPLEMIIEFHMKMPDSWSNKKRFRMNLSPCTKHTDLDNLTKTVQDALNGVAFADDSQIVSLKANKLWCDKGETYVIIRELDSE